MKKYTVLVDTLVEGQSFLAGATIPDGHRLTIFPDQRAASYVEAGLIEEIKGEDDVDNATQALVANPLVGSAQNNLNADGNGAAIDTNTSGVIDPDKHSKADLVELAKKTPGVVFDENDTKAKIADAINTAIATYAANQARGSGGTE